MGAPLDLEAVAARGEEGDVYSRFTNPTVVDTKSIIPGLASPTHCQISPEARAASVLTEGLLRIAMSLESVDDVYGALLPGLS